MYMATVGLLPDEAVAFITNALIEDGFRETSEDYCDTAYVYGPDDGIIDEAAVTRYDDGSVRIEITHAGWRYNDERFDQPHESIIEFIPTEDGSKIEVTGWVHETVEDYLLALDAPLEDERITTSYGLAYRKFVPGFIENLGHEGWTEQPKRYPNERIITDGKGGQALIASQKPGTIAQISSELDGSPASERFVITPVRGRTYVYISGDTPLLSLDIADRAASAVVTKELAQISL